MICIGCSILRGINLPSTSRAGIVNVTAISLRRCSTKATKPSLKNVKRSDLRRLLQCAAPYKRRIIGGLSLMSISATIGITLPLFYGKIMDICANSCQTEGGAEPTTTLTMHSGLIVSRGAKSSDDNNITDLQEEKSEKKQGLLYILRHRQFTLKEICTGLGIAFLVSAATITGRIYLLSTTAAYITNNLRRTVYGSILKQEIAFFDKNKTGELVNRLSNDATMIGHSVSMNISDGLRSLTTCVGSTAMMVYVSPQLSIVGIMFIPVVGVLAIVYGKIVTKITKRMNDALAGATQVAEERISGIRTVRAFASENAESNHYSRKIEAVLSLARYEGAARALFIAATGLSANAVMLAILYSGGTLITSGAMSIGELSSFMVYAIYVAYSVEGLGGFYSELVKGIAAGSRLFELADRHPLIPISGGRILPDVKGHIQFKNVHFTYDPQKSDETEKNELDLNSKALIKNSPVLLGIDLELMPGTTTAVVGASGSGKSTLAALLLRFYDAERGEIILDGQNILKLDATWLRQNVAIVPQEPQLFSTSIGENIAYGASDPNSVTLDQIEEAARQANAFNFIHSMPQGFDTIVGERGATLSGGQKQRIAIARALISQPKILVLDEATSALDAESEYQVRKALEVLLKDQSRTVLIIAHRLSTIRNADQIAVLSDGLVKELGTYEVLARKKDGFFRQLIDKQQFEINVQEEF